MSKQGPMCARSCDCARKIVTSQPETNDSVKVMTKTDQLLLLAAVIVLLLAIVVVVLLWQMKRRRRLLRLRDKVIAEELEKYEEMKNELKQKAII